MKVILAADHSVCSEEALNFIKKMNWDDDDQFMLISVVEGLPDAPALFPASAKKHLEEQFEDRQELLNKFGEDLNKSFKPNSVETNVCCGTPAKEICKFATAWSADVIVIGYHGRKGFEHLLLGSVAEEVLKKAPCSVHVIKNLAKKGQVHSEKSEKKEKAPANN